MPSFEEKVEALRRIRDRMAARPGDGGSEGTAAAVAGAGEAPTAAPASGRGAAGDACAGADRGRGGGGTSAGVGGYPAEARGDASDNRPGAAPASPAERRPGLGAVPQELRQEPAAPGGVAEADALFCAAHCLEHGLHGCDQSFEEAAEMYQAAAEEGHLAAAWRLGELLEYGRGVDQDEIAAVRWYRMAAERGFAQAQTSFALALEEGRGCDLDEPEALQWHLRAAEQGNVLSQYCAACCLFEGRGAPQDEVEARRWLQISADGGFVPALRRLQGEDEHPREGEGEGIADGGCGGTRLLGLAERIARQLQELGDEDAADVLEELLAEVPDLMELGDSDSDSPGVQDTILSSKLCN